jgi:S1-C subfamily serine protease
MLPRGQSLGSGSGFIVDSQGYIVTNFHVIERAYQLQSTAETLNKMTSAFVQNLTEITGFSFNAINATVRQLSAPYQDMPLPEVYVRVNGDDTRYQKCRIVDVKSDLDVAVLKIVNPMEDDVLLSPVEFGSSSDLLVGQSLVAIGNPFGLDNSVTTGVVSALNRDLQSVGGQSRMSNAKPLRNCIQTDASINPGTSC